MTSPRIQHRETMMTYVVGYGAALVLTPERVAELGTFVAACSNAVWRPQPLSCHRWLLGESSARGRGRQR